MSWNQEHLRYVQRQRYGEIMFVSVTVISGVLCYLLNMMCQYDLESKKELSRGKYFLRMDKRKGITLVLCLILSAGFTWLFSQYHYGPLKNIRYVLLLGALYPIAWEDARERKIPNRWLIYSLLCRGILFLAEAICFPALLKENIIFILVGGMISGAIFFIAYVLSKHAIGMGDVKLFAVLGLYLGIGTTYMVMLVSLTLSAVYGIILVLRKKKSIKDEIAFGPFIAAGTLIVLLIGA